MGGRGQRHWLFREVMEAEGRHNFRSTFLFAAGPSFSPGASPLDVYYDVSAPRFRRTFREIRERGCEIGLHVSYNARESAARIAGEKQALERAAGAEVLGCRHHYWHMKRPFWATLEDHARAGMAYDASVAFEHAPGFRLGVAFPFYPWNPEAERAVATLQIPTMAMDGGFFYRRGQTSEAVLAHVRGLLNNLKKYEGVAAIDWHEYTSFPGHSQFHEWGEAYLAILDLLASDSEIQVQNCAEAVRSHVSGTGRGREGGAEVAEPSQSRGVSGSNQVFGGAGDVRLRSLLNMRSLRPCRRPAESLRDERDWRIGR